MEEILKEEKTIGQIASEQGIHPNQLNRWKAVALEGLPIRSARTTRRSRSLHSNERQIHELYAEIGRVITQLTWLPKKSGIDSAKG